MKEKKERKDRTVLYACLGAAVAGIVLGVLCYMFFMSMFRMGVVEDVNGPEDTSLATITAEQILQNNYNSTTSVMSSASEYGGHTNVRGSLSEYDRDMYIKKCRQISGILTLQATNVDANELTLEIDSTLQSGNMEIFIIVDGELAQMAQVNRTETITLTGIAGKDVVVRIGAESAQMEIRVERTY